MTLMSKPPGYDFGPDGPPPEDPPRLKTLEEVWGVPIHPMCCPSHERALAEARKSVETLLSSRREARGIAAARAEITAWRRLASALAPEIVAVLRAADLKSSPKFTLHHTHPALDKAVHAWVAAGRPGLTQSTTAPQQPPRAAQ